MLRHSPWPQRPKYSPEIQPVITFGRWGQVALCQGVAGLVHPEMYSRCVLGLCPLGGGRVLFSRAQEGLVFQGPPLPTPPPPARGFSPFAPSNFRRRSRNRRIPRAPSRTEVLRDEKLTENSALRGQQLREALRGFAAAGGFLKP